MHSWPIFLHIYILFITLIWSLTCIETIANNTWCISYLIYVPEDMLIMYSISDFVFAQVNFIKFLISLLWPFHCRKRIHTAEDIMMTRQFLGLVACATIAIVLMQISSSTACMCMPKHSQTSYCDSDYGKCDGKLMCIKM